MCRGVGRGGAAWMSVLTVSSAPGVHALLNPLKSCSSAIRSTARDAPESSSSSAKIESNSEIWGNGVRHMGKRGRAGEFKKTCECGDAPVDERRAFEEFERGGEEEAVV